MAASDPHVLPADLPVPTDDGAAGHLLGKPLPRIPLRATSGLWVNLGFLARPTVLYFYPRTGIPGQPPSLGFAGEEWDSIPGARGCTPQSCGFRDLHAEFAALGVDVFGVSTNTTDHQLEFKTRNHVPFDFLSDNELALTRIMRLPSFQFPVESGGPNTLIHRMAWMVEPMPQEPNIVQVWYPVFPPNENAANVLAWLHQRPQRSRSAAPVPAATLRADPVEPRDLDFVRAQLHTHWHGTTIYSLDKPYQADMLPGFIARRGDEQLGLLTYAVFDSQLEIVTVSSVGENQGVGSALMAAAEAKARERACRRIFLTTTNDNLRALRFYQRRGYRLVAVHRGMMDRYRERQKTIPLMGLNGIPLHDEIELELTL